VVVKIAGEVAERPRRPYIHNSTWEHFYFDPISVLSVKWRSVASVVYHPSEAPHKHVVAIFCLDFVKDASTLWLHSLFIQLQQNALTFDRHLSCNNLQYIRSCMFQLEMSHLQSTKRSFTQ
jgi:hypothetical protein